MKMVIILCLLAKPNYNVDDCLDDENKSEGNGDFGDWSPLQQVRGDHNVNVDAQQVLDELEIGPEIDDHLDPHFPFLNPISFNPQQPHVDLQKG